MVYMYIKHKEISEGVVRIIRSEPQDKSILFMYQKMCLRGLCSLLNASALQSQ